MTLETAARKYPKMRVRLSFKNGKGQVGTLETTAEQAFMPNRSMRYFPPDGETPDSLGWPVPYWYAEEIVGVAQADAPKEVSA